MTVARSWKLLLTSILVLGVLLSSSLALAGCGEEKTTTTAATVSQDSASIIADRVLQVLASTPQGDVEYAANAISGTDLAAKLAEPSGAGKLYVLDIRSRADYDKGHIQGASQVEFKDWAAPDNLAKYPKDKKIIVVCYTGNTAAQTVAGLRLLGYDAAALKGGINGWASGQTQGQVADEIQAGNFAMVNTPATNESAPVPAGTTFDQPSASGHDVIAEKANTIFSALQPATLGSVIKAPDLDARLKDPAQKDKLFLLDIRSQTDYDKGHIEGADMRVDFKALAVPVNLDKLKKLAQDKQIVVICYTGNTAGQAVTMLKMLGYDAVVLKYGMVGWAPGADRDAYLNMINGANNPVVTS